MHACTASHIRHGSRFECRLLSPRSADVAGRAASPAGSPPFRARARSGNRARFPYILIHKPASVRNPKEASSAESHFLLRLVRRNLISGPCSLSASGSYLQAVTDARPMPCLYTSTYQGSRTHQRARRAGIISKYTAAFPERRLGIELAKRAIGLHGRTAFAVYTVCVCVCVGDMCVARCWPKFLINGPGASLAGRA